MPIKIKGKSRQRLNPIDWTLLVIASGGSVPLEPVQLQKSLFLLSKKLTRGQLQTGNFYEFDAYDYGPFSRAIYADAEHLELEGFIRIQAPPESRYKTFTVTRAGKKRADEIRDNLDPKVSSFVDKIVQFTQSVSFNELVGAIYKEYPEMKVNSVFRG